MMLEFRFIAWNIFVIIDTDQQEIPFVMLQSVRILLAFDLRDGGVSAPVVFQFDQQSRFIWIFRRWQVNDVRKAFARVEL